MAVAFLWPFKWLFGAVVLYVFLGLIALGAAFLFAAYQWADPVQASDILFQSESARVRKLMESGYVGGMASLVQWTQQGSYWLFFKATSLHDAAYAVFTGQPVSRLDRLYLSQFVKGNAREIYLAMNIIQVYGIRIGFLLASIPLFWLLYAIAGIDGLAERYIRRACSGRESADLNKIGRISKLMFCASASTLYLCTPIKIDPFWVIVPPALFFVVGTRMQWQFYKKYL